MNKADSIALKKNRLKQITGYIRKFYTSHLNPFDLVFGLLCVVLITYYNYSTDRLIVYANRIAWEEGIFRFYFLAYLAPFALGFLQQSISHKDWSYWKDWRFHALSLFTVLVFSFRSSVHLLIEPYWDTIRQWENYRYWFSMLLTVVKMAVVFGLVGLYYLFFEKEKGTFYGFTLKGFNTRPYFVMLLIMLPLIVLASTQSDFLSSYPRALKYPMGFEEGRNGGYLLLFELLYALDFFSIEFFFRGFVVLAFLRIAGPRILIPMALFYVMIHIGKPAGELVSSFFGGSLLGIIVYYSRSIIGGIIVHVGIALMMELGAFIGLMLTQ